MPRREGGGLFYHDLTCQWLEFSVLNDVLMEAKGVAAAACLGVTQQCPEATWREGGQFWGAHSGLTTLALCCSWFWFHHLW